MRLWVCSCQVNVNKKTASPKGWQFEMKEVKINAC